MTPFDRSQPQDTFACPECDFVASPSSIKSHLQVTHGYTAMQIDQVLDRQGINVIDANLSIPSPYEDLIPSYDTEKPHKISSDAAMSHDEHNKLPHGCHHSTQHKEVVTENSQRGATMYGFGLNAGDARTMIVCKKCGVKVPAEEGNTDNRHSLGSVFD